MALLSTLLSFLMSTSFFGTLSLYCQNLAPVAGPFLQATGHLAGAIEASEQGRMLIENENQLLEAGLPTEEGA